MGKKRNLYNALLILILIFIATITGIGNPSASNNQTNIVHHQINHNSSIDNDIEDDSASKEVQALVEKYQNSDIKAKLVIEGMNIDEIVLQSSNNDFYLNHDASRNYAGLGSITLDYRTNIGDKKILIFGHSSIYQDVPFNELERYYDKAFYDNHKYIKLIGLDKTYTYEIFSVHVETSDFTYMNLKISEDTYNEYLRKYKAKSLYDTEVSVKDNDEILILQTCSNSPEYAKYEKKYLLIVAKKIKNREVN